MRVLVTGGAGFIGSHVVDALLAAGHDPVVLDSLTVGVHPASIPASLPVALVKADVRDADAVAGALAGVDAVVHLAAKVGLGVDVRDLPAYAADNVLGTAVLLAAAAEAGVRRLVLSSSMVVYGEGAYGCWTDGPVAPGPRAVADLGAGRFEPPCPRCGAPLAPETVGEDARLDPRNAYAVTKVSQEQLATAWARETGATVVALRYHNVYGPRMPRDTPYAGVAALFRSALERGEAPTVHEDGAQQRDFVHVSDVAAANVLALTTDAPGAYNIASGSRHTVGELATALSAAFGGPAPVITGHYRLGDVRHVVGSPELARQRLGFTASVPFEVGMKEFAAAPLR